VLTRYTEKEGMQIIKVPSQSRTFSKLRLSTDIGTCTRSSVKVEIKGEGSKKVNDIN